MGRRRLPVRLAAMGAMRRSLGAHLFHCGRAACTRQLRRFAATRAPAPPGDRIASLPRADTHRVTVPFRRRRSGRFPDCSGLVFFVLHELGISVPRTAAEQSFAATPVDPADLEPGDVLFFRDSGPPGHSRRRLHRRAPVRARAKVWASRELCASLQDDYYRATFLGAGRFYAEPPHGAAGRPLY